MSRITTYKTYKTLNNVQFWNKKMHLCSIVNSPLCSFCGEALLNLFYECKLIESLWNQLCIFFHEVFIFPLLTPQTAIFGATDKLTLDENRLLKNHIPLIFKLYIYISHEKHMLNLSTLLKNVEKNKKV